MTVVADPPVESGLGRTPVFQDDKTVLHLGDALAELRHLPDQSFDLAIVDPPYGASSKAVWRLQADHKLSRFGGAWQLAGHEWDQLSALEGFQFTLTWLTEVQRLVRPTGSVWIHATYHNGGMTNVACQMLGIEIINEVVWYKRNAFPNLSARRLTASHETLLWVHTGGSKRRYRFNYDAVKAAAFTGQISKPVGRQLRTVWDIPNNKTRIELSHGRHPTQKPLALTDRLFLVAGAIGGSVLVPFAGSGTELVAARHYGMSAMGFEIDPEYAALAARRLSDEA